MPIQQILHISLNDEVLKMTESLKANVVFESHKFSAILQVHLCGNLYTVFTNDVKTVFYLRFMKIVVYHLQTCRDRSNLPL